MLRRFLKKVFFSNSNNNCDPENTAPIESGMREPEITTGSTAFYFSDPTSSNAYSTAAYLDYSDELGLLEEDKPGADADSRFDQLFAFDLGKPAQEYLEQQALHTPALSDFGSNSYEGLFNIGGGDSNSGSDWF